MIHLAVDAEDAFDYENSEKAKYTVHDLKNILAREIKEVQTEVAMKGKTQEKTHLFTSFDSSH